MTGSPSSVLTMGLGSWGSPGLMLTLGYGIPIDVSVPIPTFAATPRPDTMRARQRAETMRSGPRPDTMRGGR